MFQAVHTPAQQYGIPGVETGRDAHARTHAVQGVGGVFFFWKNASCGGTGRSVGRIPSRRYVLRGEDLVATASTRVSLHWLHVEYVHTARKKEPNPGLCFQRRWCMPCFV